jgi:hypothetical protein
LVSHSRLNTSILSDGNHRIIFSEGRLGKSVEFPLFSRLMRSGMKTEISPANSECLSGQGAVAHQYEDDPDIIKKLDEIIGA